MNTVFEYKIGRIWIWLITVILSEYKPYIELAKTDFSNSVDRFSYTIEYSMTHSACNTPCHQSGLRPKTCQKQEAQAYFFNFRTKCILFMQTYQSATISFYLPIMMILFCTCILYKSGSNALRRMERGHISSQKFKQFSPKSSHRKGKFGRTWLNLQRQTNVVNSVKMALESNPRCTIFFLVTGVLC